MDELVTGKKGRSMIGGTGRVINEAISIIVFSILDILDFVLCLVYKVADFMLEAEWRPCYCSPGKEAITRSGKILVSEKGVSKVVSLRSTSPSDTHSSNKLHLEDVSDTLYNRPSLFSEMSKTTVNELRKLKVVEAAAKVKVIVRFSSSSAAAAAATAGGNSSSSSSSSSSSCDQKKNASTGKKMGKSSSRVCSSFTVNSTIVEMLQGKIGRQQSHPIPRWSDCDCRTCTCWTNSSKENLYVRIHGATPQEKKATEDVLFIHGFISSSKFWTETVFPNLSSSAKSKYRCFAVDLLGFGRSPKPSDSLYTLREHVEMIERSVLDPHKVKSFHVVAHSLGCILALALAVKHPASIKSLTLLAPPYFPAPKGEPATMHVLRCVAPRRVWPPIAFGASIVCWYEHISRTLCLLISKNHRLWEFLTKLIARNRIRTFLIEGFFCHTHNAAWHTLHNIICGTASKLEGYLDTVRDGLKCDVTILHGRDDELIPIECSYHVQSKIPRSKVKIIDNKDHITIVVGRQQAFARELEQIWKQASSSAAA